MVEALDCDLCILGAGAGGLAVAAGAARMGARVVLVEAARMGGDCLHAGCVPSKALLAVAARVRAAREVVRLGVTVATDGVDFARVRARVAEAVAAVAPRDSEERFTALGVRVIRGHGRFTGPDRVVADGVAIRARRFVVATGSRPAVPHLPGLDRIPALTAEDLFGLDRRPEHLLVVGGGPVGAELAQAMARLGARVTLVQRRRLLPRLPEDLVAPVRAALRADGVELWEHTRIERVAPGPVLHLARDGQRTAVAGSHLLLAAGRVPNVEDLGLEAAGIAVGPDGIRTDARLRTTNRRVFAVGDVTDRPRFTHAALQQAGVVLRNALLGLPARVDDRLVPRSVYTDPEVVVAGRLEPAPGVHFVDLPFAENDRALVEGCGEGRLRLAVDRRRRLLGVGIVGARAAEIHAALAPFLAGRGRLADLARAVLPYPTFGELAKRAAGLVFEPLVFGPWVRRWVRLVGRLP